jgi:putative spermidine/putrescine transport system permease protein
MRKAQIAAALLFLFLAVLPLAAGLLQASLQSLGLMGLLSKGFTLGHWYSLLGDGAFWAALAFSFYVASVGTLLALGLSLFFVGTQQARLGQSRYQTFLFLPLALPALVMAFFSYQLLSGSGLLSRVAFAFGFIQQPNDFAAGVGDAYGIGIIFTHVLMSTYFFSVYFSQIWQKEQLPLLLQGAVNLGATAKQAFWRIAVPTLLKRAQAIITLYFVFALGTYEIPLLLGRSYPQMLSVFTVSKLQKFNLYDIPQAYAAAVFFAVLLFISMSAFETKTRAL